jgi:hypothetical protein
MDRRVLGIVGGELSSSDESSLGGGDLRPAGSKAMASLTVADPLGQMFREGRNKYHSGVPRHLSMESSDVNRKLSVSRPHSWTMSNISLASGAVLFARFA